MNIINDNKSKDSIISNLDSQLQASQLAKRKYDEVEQSNERLEYELNDMKAKYLSLEQKFVSEINDLKTKSAEEIESIK